MKSLSIHYIASYMIFMFGCIAFVAGCATPAGPIQVYQGSKRPQDEIMTLIVPTALEVLAVDGKEIDLPYFTGKDYKMELLPGIHKLQVIYKESWGDSTSSAVVVSDVSSFRLSAVAGTTMMLKHDGPRDLVTASRFSDMPTIWLFDPDTDQRIQPYAIEKYVPALFRAMHLSTSDTKIARTMSAEQSSSMAVAEDMVMQQDALQRLQFWWKMAGEQDRKAFKAWLAKNAPTE